VGAGTELAFQLLGVGPCRLAQPVQHGRWQVQYSSFTVCLCSGRSAQHRDFFLDLPPTTARAVCGWPEGRLTLASVKMGGSPASSYCTPQLHHAKHWKRSSHSAAVLSSQESLSRR
jgi:hypothetical protein